MPRSRILLMGYFLICLSPSPLSLAAQPENEDNPLRIAEIFDEVQSYLGDSEVRNLGLSSPVFAPLGREALSGRAQAARDKRVVGIGDRHYCVTALSGRLECFGLNNDHQAEVPSNLGTIKSVVPGDRHTCVLEEGGTVRCWGANDHGQTTVPLDLSLPVVSLAAGTNHTCAGSLNGELRCWGSNQEAQSHWPDNWGRLEGTGVKEGIAARKNLSCVLTKVGEIRCWGTYGFERYTQVIRLTANDLHSRSETPMGLTVCTKPKRLVPQSALTADTDPNLLSPQRFTSVSVGDDYVCGVTELGTIECLNLGQSLLDIQVPTWEVIGPVATVAAGKEITCALTTNGTLKCWFSRRLYYGQKNKLLTFEKAAKFQEPFKFLSRGAMGTLALTKSGEYALWREQEAKHEEVF